MRHFLPLIFAAFLSLNSSVQAQSFVLGNGTEWTYCQYDWLPTPHYETRTIQVVGDTLINGEQALVIEGDCQCGHISPKYIRKEEDKIYYYINDDKYLLYDFSLNAGDLLIVSIPDYSDAHFIIDSIDVILLNNEPKKVQYFTFINMDNGLFPDWGTRFIEDFGSDRCLFPLIGVCDPGTGPLLTIEVPGFPIAEIDDAECIILDTKELEQMSISVFPIPAKDELIISYTGSSGKMDINIFNVMGSIVESFILNGAEQRATDVSSWLPGIYILQVRSGNRIATSKILIGMK